MASTLIIPPFFIILALALAVAVAHASLADATVMVVHSDSEEMLLSVYDDVNADVIDGGDDEDLLASSGRSLLWWRMRYYISYGALSANRIPCPPRSGRSYYTRNCWRARGPVRPYSRGCSTITRCRR